METFVVWRVEVILDGRVHRWYAASDQEAARIVDGVRTYFPDVTVMPTEMVKRHTPVAA